MTQAGIGESGYRAVADEYAAHIESREFVQAEERVPQADVGVDDVAVELECFKGQIQKCRWFEEGECVKMKFGGPQRGEFHRLGGWIDHHLP